MAKVIGYIWLGSVAFLACALVVAWALRSMGERLRRFEQFDPLDVFADDDDEDGDYIMWLERSWGPRR